MLWKILLGKTIWKVKHLKHLAPNVIKPSYKNIYQNIHPSLPDPPGRCSFHRSPHPLNRPTVGFDRTFLLFQTAGFFSTPFRGKHQICWDYCQGTKLPIFTLTFTGRKINCICGGSIFFWWSWKIFDKLSFIIEWFIELCLKAVKVSGGWFGWWWYHQSNVSDTFWSREWDALSKKRVLVDCKKVNKWWSVGLNST